MATNHPLCNIFTQVINAAFHVACGEDSVVAIDELIRHHVDDFVSTETFDAIQSALMDIEIQMDRPEEGVRMVVEHSVVGKTPEGRSVITPTSEAAHDKLMEMGFKSNVDSIVYDANRSVPTIITHHVVEVKTVIPGPDSREL